jgi:hypothetical protein
MIYLISIDGHRDSIDLEYYFTNEEQIESWIKKYRKEYFDENVRNVKVNFDKEEVSFEVSWINDNKIGRFEWEEVIYYLFKLNKYE